MMLESAILGNETVMHRLTHIVAGVTVVFHMMGGCCLHHAHAACAGECRGAPQAVDCRSCDDHGHADHYACPSERPQPHDHGCDTAPCVFVLPETQGVVRIAPVEPLGSLPADVDARCPATQVAFHRADSWHPRLTGALRLHLLNQVLLL